MLADNYNIYYGNRKQLDNASFLDQFNSAEKKLSRSTMKNEMKDNNLNDVTQVDGNIGEALFTLNQANIQLGFLVKLGQLLLELLYQQTL